MPAGHELVTPGWGLDLALLISMLQMLAPERAIGAGWGVGQWPCTPFASSRAWPC